MIQRRPIRYLILFYLCITISQNSYSQAKIESYLNQGIHHSLDFDYSKADSFFQEVYDLIDTTAFQPLYVKGKFYQIHQRLWELRFEEAKSEYLALKKYCQAHQQKEWEKRIELIESITLAHERSFSIFYKKINNYLVDYKNLYGEHPDILIWQPYFAFALHFSQHDFDMAFRYYHKSIRVYEQHFPEGCGMQDAVKILLAILLHYQDDDESADQIINNIITDCEKRMICRSKILPVAYNWKSSFLFNNNKIEEGYLVAQKGYKISQNNYQKGFNAIMIGKYFSYKKDLEKTKHYYKEGLSLLKKSFGIHPEYMVALGAYINALKRLNKFDEIISLAASLKNVDYSYEINSYGGRLEIHRVLMDYYLQQKDYIKCIQHCHKFLIISIKKIKEIEGFNTPSLDKFPVHQSSVNALNKKAAFCYLYYQENPVKNKVFLEYAFDAANKSSILMEQLLARVSNVTSRNSLLEKAREALDLYIPIAYDLYIENPDLENVKQLLLLFERGRTLELYRSLKQSDNTSIYIDSLYELRKVNLEKLVDLDRVLSLENDQVAKKKKDLLENEILGIDQILRSETTSFNQFTLDDDNVFEKALSISNEQQIVYYHYQDTLLYIMEILNGQCIVSRKILPDNFQGRLYSITDHICQPFIKANYSTANLSQQDCQSELDYFSKYLKAPLKFDSPRQMVLLDKYLELLPFELLNKNKVVNRQHSLATYSTISEKKNIPTDKISIYTPHFSNDSINTKASRVNFLGTLIHADKEKRNISQCAKNARWEVFTPFSTQQNFKEALLTDEIIHLITHAKQDNINYKNSFIAFNNQKNHLDKLYYDKLQFYQTNAELITLSACETAIGTYQAGEGLYSFEKQFLANGAKSVVSTLWSVNGQSTTQIMSSFYDFLFQGFPKDEALMKAKNEYLKTAEPSMQHPYYWAGIILTGDPSPLVISSSPKFTIKHLITLIVFILLLLSYFYNSKFKRIS